MIVKLRVDEPVRTLTMEKLVELQREHRTFRVELVTCQRARAAMEQFLKITRPSQLMRGRDCHRDRPYKGWKIQNIWFLRVPVACLVCHCEATVDAKRTDQP